MVDTAQLLPEVKQFLEDRPVRMYIGGQWVNAEQGGEFETRDPGDGQVLATVCEGTAADIDKAVQAGRSAFQESGWSTMSTRDRSRKLNELADLIDKHQAALAQLESLDVGKPLAQAGGFDVPNVAQTLRWYADFAMRAGKLKSFETAGYEARQFRVPYGLAAFVLPWNFPMLLVGWNIAPALAAGNTVLIKPAEDTPLSTLYFCKLVEEAGFPPGVINVVPGMGDVAGQALAEHPHINRMGFTGSPEVGRLIAAACGRNLVPAKLELGGKGAAVVFDDVDPGQVARDLVTAVTLNTGQVCCTATRWVVHQNIRDAFIEEAVSQMQSLKIGHGLNPETQMGPAVSEKQRQRILTYLDKGQVQGAEAPLAGGAAEVPEHPDGFYVKPALLEGQPDNICACEEIFGPVAFVMTFEQEAEAIDLVNRSDYGLANSVWSTDLERANRVAEDLVAGNSWINGHNLFPHGVPYAGCNLSGCGGGVLGQDTYFDYLRPQSVVRRAG